MSALPGPPLEPDLARVRRGGRAREQRPATRVAAALGRCRRSEAAVALARLELLGYVRVDAAGRYARTALIAAEPPVAATVIR